MHGAKIELKLLGPFRACHGGNDCTPRGRKACALLAMLALSSGHKRTRVWLQDKLWGSRGKEQAAASLRQTLFEIRKTFGDAHDCIISDSFNVSLDPSLFQTDLATAGASEGAELLEGFDIAEEGFEDWLREQRMKLASAPIASPVRYAEPRARPDASRAPHPQNTILLLRGARADQTGISVLADSLVDAVAKSISELAAAIVIDRRAETELRDEASGRSDPLALHTDIVGSEAQQIVRLALLQLPENTLSWSSTLQASDPRDLDLNEPSVLRCINLAVSVAIDQLARLRSRDSDRTASSALCHSGIAHLFRLGKTNFDTADRLLAAAFEIEPRGVYLAWRAYLRTFLLAERERACRQTIEAEAFDFVRRALESEPHNSYVAGLSAHVHAIMRRSYVAAYELAERSVVLNRANPFGWACLGVAECYLGKSEDGFRHTLLARTIAGSSPFRYQLDAISCTAGTMAGDFDKAVYLGEASHALAPRFAPPLRYLSALYAHQRQPELSYQMVQRLRASEPDFSYDMLRDKGYPAAGLHRAGLIASLPKRQI
jgi:hypothetical protein